MFRINYFKLFKLSIIHGIEFQLINDTPLLNASKSGYTDIVRLLLSQPGIEINCKNL